MIVQIIDFCDPNNQEKREDFWMYKLQTLYPEGLNIKIINKKGLELSTLMHFLLFNSNDS